MIEYARERELGDEVVRAAVTIAPRTLRQLGHALALGGGPMRRLGEVFAGLADDVEERGGPSNIEGVRMTAALRLALFHSEFGQVRQRLRDAESEPWLTLRRVFVELDRGRRLSSVAEG